MSPRVFQTLVAALIRIGLLLALVIMLMAENAQAEPPARNRFSSPAPGSSATDWNSGSGGKIQALPGAPARP